MSKTDREMDSDLDEAVRKIRGQDRMHGSHRQVSMWSKFAKGDYDCEGASIIEVLQFKIEKMKTHMLHCSDASLDYTAHTASDMQRVLDLGYRIFRDDYNTGSTEFEEQNSNTVIHLKNNNADGSETEVKSAIFRSADLNFVDSDALNGYLGIDELSKKYDFLVFSMETVWDKPKDDAIWKKMIKAENRKKSEDTAEYFREVGIGSQKWWD